MYKNDKNYYAGANEVHRFGREARERVMRSLEPTIPTLKTSGSDIGVVVEEDEKE